jgi:hypothetical protein
MGMGKQFLTLEVEMICFSIYMMMMLLVLLFNDFKWVFGGGRMLLNTMIIPISTQLNLLKLIPQLGKNYETI